MHAKIKFNHENQWDLLTATKVVAIQAQIWILTGKCLISLAVYSHLLKLIQEISNQDWSAS